MPNIELIEMIEAKYETPEVPKYCSCGGEIVLDDYDSERYICTECLKIY